MTNTATPPPHLDPPFRGYIETTFDALLVFEAARRGMIPRVTRRLIERERGMVQSGAVFVFDEHESGIKRWTDGLVWSPSRILGNFLVYRETDKKPANPPTPMSTSGPASSSPQQPSPPGAMPHAYNDTMNHPVLGHGALPRPRSDSDGGGNMDRQRERQLVGSLTNSYKFKGNGLVKKTMSVTVNGFAQHMISYYSVEDVLSGKLRSPSTVPELAALEISPEYLHKQNFRFPPMIEVGQDGIPRYRGEPEEPSSPQSPHGSGTYPELDAYGQPLHRPLRIDPSARQRSTTAPMPIPMGQPPYSPAGPSSSSSAYFDHSQLGLVRQNSNSSLHSASGAIRPGSSSRRYDPYNPTSPRSSLHARRQSQPLPPPEYYAPSANLDVKPQISPGPTHAPNPYHYQPPATAPSAFADFGSYSHHPPPQQYAPQYTAWHPPPPATASGRFHTQQQPREYEAPVETPAQQQDNWAPSVLPPPQPPHSWDQGYPVQDPTAEWRGHGTGTSVG